MTDAQEPALAVRAAWLYYVHGLTQAQVAEHLALSRVKVHRLIAQAHRQNSVKVFVEGSSGECVMLEERIKSAFGLALVRVAPSDTAAPAVDATLLRGLGAAAGLLLHQYLEKHPGASVGVGHGRTLAAVADALPRVPRPRASFVSILGSLTRRSTANPFDVIYRFAERTGAAGYFVPAPFFVDSVDDAETFRSQRVVRDVLERARRADVHIVGIGNLTNTPAIYAAERKSLRALGIVAEVLGQFFDGEGREVQCDMAARSISLRLSELRNRRVIGVAGGIDKAAAMRATLASGLLTGLVTDEATAREVLRKSTPRHSRVKRSAVAEQGKTPSKA